jgi:FkbM family methyltransferase
MLPTAEILALEANPRNFELMETDEELRRKSIRILQLAASDRDGEAPLYVARAQYLTGCDRARRGTSSLHRFDASQLAQVVAVRTVRLDTLLPGESLGDGPIALWIDSEGKGLEVIRGSSAILASTRMLHVEVETRPFIGAEQKLFADVERELSGTGFELLATDQPRNVLQFNALFVRVDLLAANAAECRKYVKRAHLRRSIRNTVLRLLPARVRALSARLALSETRIR